MKWHTAIWSPFPPQDDQGDETEETEVPLYFDSEKQYEETILFKTPNI